MSLPQLKLNPDWFDEDLHPWMLWEDARELITGRLETLHIADPDPYCKHGVSFELRMYYIEQYLINGDPAYDEARQNQLRSRSVRR